MLQLLYALLEIARSKSLEELDEGQALAAWPCSRVVMSYQSISDHQGSVRSPGAFQRVSWTRFSSGSVQSGGERREHEQAERRRQCQTADDCNREGLL